MPERSQPCTWLPTWLAALALLSCLGGCGDTNSPSESSIEKESRPDDANSAQAVDEPVPVAVSAESLQSGEADHATTQPHINEPTHDERTKNENIAKQGNDAVANDSPPPAAGEVVSLDDCGDLAESGSIDACLTEDTGFVDDPESDGWSTEVFHNRAKKQLKKVVQKWASFHLPDADHWQPYLGQDFVCSDLRPRQLQTVYEYGGTTVRRQLASDVQAVDAIRFRGLNGMIDAATELRSPFAPIIAVADPAAAESHHDDSALQEESPIRFFTKITRVNAEESGVRTVALVDLYASLPEGSLQVNATIDCSWIQDAESGQPLLASVICTDYEEIEIRGEAPKLFQECTASILAGNSAYTAQLGHSADHWAQRIETLLGSDFMGYCGVSVGDVNGDGLDDIYYCQPGGLPNRLFLQQPDGTAIDASSDSRVDILDSCRSSLILDFDNDGDQDICVTSITGVLFYENDGNAKFRFRFRMPDTRLAYSMTAADYDQDGDLDVYVCLYHAPLGDEVGNPMPYHDANNGSPNMLIRNEGGWRFSNATEEAGLNQNNTRWTNAAGWEDFDNDGDMDLCVANDFGRNNLFLNMQGKFLDIAPESGVEDIASGMSVDWGDYDRDGRMDMYIANMFSSAGGRITYQRKFKPTAAGETKASLQRLARGNTLFRNRGNRTFEDTTLAAAVNMARWAWSSDFLDLNNDGWVDILAANGNYTGDDTGDL